MNPEGAKGLHVRRGLGYEGAASHPDRNVRHS